MIFQAIQDRADKHAGNKRSGHWSAVRKAFLTSFPKCAVCGGTKKLEAHHIIPFHADPSRELDPNNLIALCEGNPRFNCHFVVGHRLNFRDVNPRVVKDALYLWNMHFSAKYRYLKG